MAMEILILTWYRHKKVARLIGYHPSPLDNWISNVNTDINIQCTNSLPLKKTTHYHTMNDNINMGTTIAGAMNGCICDDNILFCLQRRRLLQFYCLDNTLFVCLMVFDATFNNIPVISRRSVLLVEETGRPGENHWPVASHWQTLSHNAGMIPLYNLRPLWWLQISPAAPK